ncbi:hypothetical protein JL102_05170 [Fulvivirga sp. 2943]|uniref:Uncharacterized protein n=2 Tax=Fulvivirga sediminis TaxID=2803949 RepID=A0A937JZR8_9BACT|nr:hypothetical protein [Fulvivirga sediminis]
MTEHNMHITKCRGCGKVTLLYNNFFVSFNTQEFFHFIDYIEMLHFANSSVKFPNGEQYVTVYTCHEDIYFIFNEGDFNEFRDRLLQVHLLLEVKHILKM